MPKLLLALIFFHSVLYLLSCYCFDHISDVGLAAALPVHSSMCQGLSALVPWGKETSVVSGSWNALLAPYFSFFPVRPGHQMPEGKEKGWRLCMEMGITGKYKREVLPTLKCYRSPALATGHRDKRMPITWRPVVLWGVALRFHLSQDAGACERASVSDFPLVPRELCIWQTAPGSSILA